MKSLFSKPLLTTCAAVLMLLSQAAFATTYFVSTAGNNSNNGLTTATAWRNIQYAANRVTAGDTIQVLSGTYNEAVTIPVSGSPTAGYVTLQNYPGQTPIVDGTGLAIPGNQSGLINLASRSYVIIQGLEIRNYKTAKTNVVPIGIYITGAGSNLQLLNNHIHDIVTSAKGCNANALGVAIYGTQAPASLNHLTITGNELNNLKTGCSESMSLNGNIDTFTVSGNRIHDNNNIGIDAIGFEGTSPNPSYDQARNGTISLNSVYNITSNGNPSYGANCTCADGIYIDGGSHIIVERNLIHNVDLGLEMASEHSGRTASYITARSNLIYFGNSAGVSIGGYDTTVGGTDHVTIVNNTLFKNDSLNTGSGEFQIQFHATNNAFENNIVYAGAQALLVNDYTKSTPSPVTLNFNLYFAPGGAGSSNWVWQATSITSFSTFQSKSGNDGLSNFLDPLFVNTTSPDLHVQANSRAVNAGTNLGVAIEGSSDYAGNARVQGSNIDIGAYEQ